MILLTVVIEQTPDGKTKDSIVTRVEGGTPNEKAILANLAEEAGQPDNRIHTALRDLCAELSVQADGGAQS